MNAPGGVRTTSAGEAVSEDFNDRTDAGVEDTRFEDAGASIMIDCAVQGPLTPRRAERVKLFSIDKVEKRSEDSWVPVKTSNMRPMSPPVNVCDVARLNADVMVQQRNCRSTARVVDHCASSSTSSSVLSEGSSFPFSSSSKPSCSKNVSPCASYTSCHSATSSFNCSSSDSSDSALAESLMPTLSILGKERRSSSNLAVNKCSSYSDIWTSVPSLRRQSLQPPTGQPTSAADIASAVARDSFDIRGGLEHIFSPLFQRVCATRLPPISRSSALLLPTSQDATPSVLATITAQHLKNDHEKLKMDRGDMWKRPPSASRFLKPMPDLVERRRSVSEPKSGSSSHRQPSLYEKLLYNPKAYALLSRAAQHEIRQKTEQFEMAWTTIRPLTYYVQDHALDCLNLDKWPDGSIQKSLFAFKYDRQCHCPYEPGVSFFVPPFCFEALYNTEGNGVETVHHDGLLGPRAAGMLATEHEAWVAQRTGHGMECVRFPRGENDSGKKVSLVQKSFNSTQKIVIDESNSVEGVNNGSDQYELPRRRFLVEQPDTSRQAKNVGLKIGKRLETERRHPLSRCLSLDDQYVRQVAPTVWIRSRPVCPGDIDHVDIVLFFGGKDMLAIDWISFVNQWIQSQAVQAGALSDLKYKETRASSNNVAATSLARPENSLASLIVPRHVPTFDSAALQQRRRSSVRAMQAARLAVNAESDTPPTTADLPLRQAELLRLVTKELGCKTKVKSLLQPPSTSVGQVEAVRLRTTCAFGLVEYPGYGTAHGLPSPSSCVDSGIEVIRHCIAHMKPTTVDLHIIGYSLGGAIASRVATLLADRITRRKTKKEEIQYPLTEPLTRITQLKTLILVAPFTTTWDCVNALLHVPKKLQDLSSYLLDSLPSRKCQYNNTVVLGRLAEIVREDLEHFSEFHFTVIFGDKDRVAPKQMGPALVSHVRRSLGKAWLAEHPSAINCIRVAGADHSSVLESSRLVKVLKRYHSYLSFCSIER